MPFEYSKKVMRHFLHPKNVGKIKNADGIGKAVSPVCGDYMLLYIKVKDEKIKDIKFQTFGCSAAIASSSVLTEMTKGKTIKEAEKITKDRVVRALGGLPYKKVHCSVLATDALKQAIKDYLKKKRAK